MQLCTGVYIPPGAGAVVGFWGIGVKTTNLKHTYVHTLKQLNVFTN